MNTGSYSTEESTESQSSVGEQFSPLIIFILGVNLLSLTFNFMKLNN